MIDGIDIDIDLDAIDNDTTYVEADNKQPVTYAIQSNAWANPKIHERRYIFLRDSYTGAGGYASGSYLIPHKREILENYRYRKAAARYSNSFKTIIDALVAPIFRGEPVRDLGENVSELSQSVYNTFYNNVDGANTPLPAFMKKLTRSAVLYDCSFVAVENRVTDNAMTKADLKKRSNLPYLIHITPDRIEDIAMSELGQVVSITWKSTESVVIKGEVTDSEVYTTWTAQSWTKMIGKEVIAQGVNELGYTPVFPLYPQDNLDPVNSPLPYGMSFGIATINYRRYNLGSVIDETVDGAAFPLLLLSGNISANSLDIGLNNALVLPEGANGAYLEPDYSFIDKMYKELYNGLEHEMYQISGVNFMKTTAQSADSRRQELERLYELLGDLKTQVQTIDKRIMDAVIDYVNITDIEYGASYPNNFGLNLVEDDLKVFESFANSDKVPQDVISEIVKRISGSVLTGLSETRKREISDLIEQHADIMKDLITVDNTDADTF